MIVPGSTAPAPAPAPASRLWRLLATSSFRLTMLYAALFGLSFSILFGTVRWSIGLAARRQIDRDVSDEVAELWSAAGMGDLASLRRAVTQFTARSPGVHYLLQDTNGAVLAGNSAAMAPQPGRRLLRPAGSEAPLRGRGQLVAGGYLFVGVDDLETPRLDAAVTRAFLISLGATIVLALGGGTLTSLGVLRRVESIGRTSREIMAGDLDRRIALRGTADEFDQLGATLNQMLDRIQGLMSGLRDVSTNIAHDLRTPLARMRQRLELATRSHSEDALREAITRSIADVDAILATFSALLRIAQVEAGTRRAEFAPVDVPDLLATLVDAYQPVAEEHGQTLAAALDRPLHIRGDRALLVQMVVNLIENAIYHCPAGARIQVRCETAPGCGAIVLADDGPGIPPAQRDQVLTRFFRLDTSRTTSGNGLGLAMVAAIATLHGARLTLQDNAPGLRVQIQFDKVL